MSYTGLTSEQYKALPLEGRVEELRKWIEDCLDNHRATIRSIANTMPEWDDDIAEVIDTPFKDLPKKINDYEEDSVAHIILKHRLDNNMITCDDSVLDLDMVGQCIRDNYLRECDSEEDVNDLQDIRSSTEDLITISRIFNFEALTKSLESWKP